ncbi:hypothetical protein CMUS01_10285 [Colletotrichum musicola]|uniref:Lpxtg-domain-containing protein n=1 Tax=Colletotrichum musicola TaxID=2175873 RepID=A0A8H6K3S4_9PEZI|nr:hypothetical protein CMUS01_10285 [Colletotrichum musicola]
MRPESASALGLLLAAGLFASSAAARPSDVRARSQQLRRRQDAQDCLEDLEDILDDAPTTSLWPATACDFTSTLSGAELTSNYASFRSRMSSWYNNDLDDISKVERSCTQYASVFSQIRYCYVTGPFPTTAGPTTASATPTTAAATTTSAGSSTASRTSTGASSTSTTSGTAAPNPDDGGGLDSGAKAGLAIGIILAVVLILFICWKFFQRYRSSRMDEAAGAAKLGGDVEPQMHAAAAIGGAGAATAGAGMAAAAARTKVGPPENSVYAYKSELSGDPRPMSELDPAAAVTAPRTTGVPPHVAELDPDPPRELSELPADNYDPTANRSPPPAYVSPLPDGSNRNTLDTAVSPLSPDASTMQQAQGLGILTGGDGAQGPQAAAPENQDGTVQQGWGRGWLRRE